MVLLEILKFPDPKLRRKCKPVDKVTAELRKFAQNMLHTMYEARGIGLAAAQVDNPVRLVVIDTRKIDSTQEEGEEASEEVIAAKAARYELGGETELERAIQQPLILFNPVVIKKNGKTTFNEGCLSVPTYYEIVERALYVEVEALNENGEKVLLKTDGLLAICIQHEIDHLDGKLFIDRLSPIKSARVKSKIKKYGYPAPGDESDDEEIADDTHHEAL